MSDLLPAKFTDTEGRSWHLAFNFGNARSIKDEVGFDVSDLQDGRAFSLLAFDHRRFAQLLWMLCEKQADRAAVDEQSFAEGFGGDVIDAAMQALEEAVVNFTPARMRSAVQKMIVIAGKSMETRGNALANAAEEKEAELMEAIRAEATQRMVDLTSANSNAG